MFNIEEIKQIKEKYYEIYQPYIERDYFSLIYDKNENEWFYIISDNITKKQLDKVLYAFSVVVDNYEKEGVDIIKFNINDYIDNNDKMMRDKNIYNLFSKFQFMYPAFYNSIKKIK